MRQADRGDATELAGLAHACDALAAGRAVVVPNPAPMTYGLVATTAERINAVKGRALDQNVAASLHDLVEWQRLTACLDLPAAALDGVSALLDRHLSVLLPLRAEVPPPDWVAPAVRDGEMFVFDGSWAATSAVWQRFPRLFGSSANRTGQPPAASAVAARDYFGSECVVIDGDVLGDRSGPQAASTVVQVDRSGRLRLYRSGAQDRSVAGTARYLRGLAGLVGMPVADDTGGRG